MFWNPSVNVTMPLFLQTLPPGVQKTEIMNKLTSCTHPPYTLISRLRNFLPKNFPKRVELPDEKKGHKKTGCTELHRAYQCIHAP